MNPNPYDILFQPLSIGPVVAPNRFYQVPHCSGMGWLRPRSLAAMRGIKAEGGWGVVNTEYCSIHPSSDDLPFPYAKLWSQDDIRAHALMTEEVHKHGALAGVELWYGGAASGNHFTREVSFDVAALPVRAGTPYHTRAMDRDDIRTFRRWHRDAGLKARQAGFDIVYVYPTHGYMLNNFLDPRINSRTDEYGGSVENRGRLLRELIEETREAIGNRCAIAVRFAVDGLGMISGPERAADTRELFESIADLPDLWDITVPDYVIEMGSSRFVKDAALEDQVAFVKKVTRRPVVSVGRFTSPDTMARQIRRGILDLIGAARPSIADPFLPKKIREGRFEDIRECIGCNVCYASDMLGVPLRCTQNPSMGEEWRKGWHPEHVPRATHSSSVLIVGAGPAGLEAAHALGKRGFTVTLAEARAELGGRVTQEARLPGLAEWARVRDYRLQQLSKLPNVTVYRESPVSTDLILDLAPEHIALATGATWRRDGLGASNLGGIAGLEAVPVFTPDDIMAGNLPFGRVALFDDDSYYMGSALAMRLVEAGCEVTFVTPHPMVSLFGRYTAEQLRTHAMLAQAGVSVVVAHNIAVDRPSELIRSCNYSGRVQHLDCDALVLVTARLPNAALALDLKEQAGKVAAAGILSITRVGDCDAPSLIAQAVYSGHRYARDIDRPAADIRDLRIDAPLSTL